MGGVQLIETPRGHLFEHAFPVNLQFDQPLTRPLECLPNRDSLVYKELYGLRDATTVFRGTLRYQVRPAIRVSMPGVSD